LLNVEAKEASSVDNEGNEGHPKKLMKLTTLNRIFKLPKNEFASKQIKCAFT
jgi:hypothetical protein